MATSPPDPVALDTLVDARLRRVNQRCTPNRLAIVEVLRVAPRPMTIPEIMVTRPDFAQSSVYRNLLILERAGLVHRIVTADEFARFELAEEFTEHHHHVICTSCGAVEDVATSTALEATLDAAVEGIARDTGFTVRHHRLDLVGLCPDCA